MHRSRSRPVSWPQAGSPTATPAYAKAATVFLPPFHCLTGGIGHVLPLRRIRIGIHLGRNCCDRGHNPHHYALVSWIVVLQADFRACTSTIGASTESSGAPFGPGRAV